MRRKSSHSTFLPAFWCSVLLWLSLATAICSSEEIVLHLKNGDRVTGTLVSTNSTEVVISTVVLGKLTVPVSQIARSETVLSPAPTTTPPSAPPIAPTATPVTSTSTNAAVAAAGAPGAGDAVKPQPAPKPAPTTSPESAKPPPSMWRKLFSGWKGDLQLGANLIFSTKNRQTYTGRMKLTHAGQPFHGHGQMRNVLDYNASYGRTEGTLSDNQMDGAWKVEYDLGKKKRFHAYNAAGAGYNSIQNIDLRYDVGPGLGYKVLVLTNFVLKAEVGGNYQKQLFADGTAKERYAMRFAEDATWQISKKLRFDEKIEFFPQVENFDNYRIRAEANLTYAIQNNLTFSLSVIDLYDKGLPAGVSKNDLQVRSLIGVKF